MTLSLLRDAYDRSAPDYDKDFKPYQWGKYQTLLGHDAHRLLHARPLLDLGCGTGLLADFLTQAGQSLDDVHGLDLSPQMVAIAKRKNIDAQEGIASNIPFKNQHFASITCFTVLRIMSTAHETQEIHEMFRVMQPKGSLYLSVLQNNYDASLDQKLIQAGFVIEEKIGCGQDLGLRCHRPH